MVLFVFSLGDFLMVTLAWWPIIGFFFASIVLMEGFCKIKSPLNLGSNSMIVLAKCSKAFPPVAVVWRTGLLSRDQFLCLLGLGL